MKAAHSSLTLVALLSSGCPAPVHNKSPIEDLPIAGEPIAGEPIAGEPIAGEPIAGEPVAGEPVAGEPVAGEPVAGEPVAGEPVAGEPVAGEPVAGEPVAGEPVAGEPVAGEPVAGEPVAGEMVEGRVLEGLSGSWSVCVDGEARSQLKRYRFEYSSASAGDWSYSESRYAELGCLGESSMTITERGAFTVAAPLAADMSLYPLDLSLNTRSLTADRESSSSLLEELCALSFPAGEPVDITEQGCERLSLAPREACPVRYDVAQIAMGALRLSDSSAPVCAAEERPDAVAEPPLSAE